jgi:hypothetical protein
VNGLIDKEPMQAPPIKRGIETMFTHEEYDRVYKRSVDANVRIGELLEENKRLKSESKIDQKLEYLDRLLDIARLDDATDDLKNYLNKRIGTVCNSIEQDLGIKPAYYDVIPKNGIVGTNADIDELIEKIKGEPLRVIKVDGTIDISQGYTGGIFDIDDIGKRPDE